jgi:hypothetical protein
LKTIAREKRVRRRELCRFSVFLPKKSAQPWCVVLTDQEVDGIIDQRYDLWPQENKPEEYALRRATRVLPKRPMAIDQLSRHKKILFKVCNHSTSLEIRLIRNRLGVNVQKKVAVI